MLASSDFVVPRVHVLVSEHELEDAAVLASLDQIFALSEPVAVHLRVCLDAGELFIVAQQLARSIEGSGSWLVVNGRPDIALAAGAHAVQLGHTAPEVQSTREFIDKCGGKLRVGASVHLPAEAASAVRAGADYLVLGTIYPTSSHPEVEASGPSNISKTVKRTLGSEVPILAIGGVDVPRTREVIAFGAYGVVVKSAVWNASDSAQVVRALRGAVDDQLGGVV